MEFYGRYTPSIHFFSLISFLSIYKTPIIIMLTCEIIQFKSCANHMAAAQSIQSCEALQVMLRSIIGMEIRRALAVSAQWPGLIISGIFKIVPRMLWKKKNIQEFYNKVMLLMRLLPVTMVTQITTLYKRNEQKSVSVWTTLHSLRGRGLNTEGKKR